MLRIILLVVVLVVLVGGVGGFLWAGLHPPAPHTHQIDRTVPNDSFKTH